MKSTKILLVITVLLISWAVLWKFNIPYIGSDQRVVNLSEPFKWNQLFEMIANVLLFLPLGILLSVFQSEKFSEGKNFAIWKQVISIIILSVFLETFQYVLACGRSDITDLILNTTGGVLGIIITKITLHLGGYPGRVALKTIALVIVIIAFILAGFSLEHLGYQF
ncbi:MAG: VanZ family protein [Candidatus Ancillula sp.]|nr:VanZ family protein [Candidatus Ancillula sp.]